MSATLTLTLLLIRTARGWAAVPSDGIMSCVCAFAAGLPREAHRRKESNMSWSKKKKKKTPIIFSRLLLYMKSFEKIKNSFSSRNRPQTSSPRQPFSYWFLSNLTSAALTFSSLPLQLHFITCWNFFFFLFLICICLWSFFPSEFLLMHESAVIVYFALLTHPLYHHSFSQLCC